MEEANDEEGISLPIHNMMKSMLADKAAAQASGKKRIREEARGGEEVPSLSALNMSLSIVCSPPPGFSGKPQHIPSRHDGDTTDGVAARELVQGAVAPPLERAFAANGPTNIVKLSCAYVAVLHKF